MPSLLVTNDFPPKVGGIQSYLWELWRRLPADEFSVLTTPHEGDRAWDAQQPFEVRRTKQWWLLPTRKLVAEINAVARDTQAELVVLDPVVPRKGFDRLVKAAAMMRSTHPRLHVLIAGAGRERGALDKLIEKTNAPVTMLGRVPDEDLPGLYGAADAFCMPCHDRWFGLER